NNKTDTSLFPKGIRTVKYGSIKSIYEWMTAKIWIDNVKQYYKLKRKGQYYLQTWHGGVSLKRVEKAVEDSLDIGYVNASKIDSTIIDAMISNSNWQTNDYKTNFWYNGPIFEFGLPRNDIFFHNTEIISKKVKDFF
ncbi:TPA: CDP-glycerol glycerophosphotransferase family protein, partial [Streptococcus suis]|nr:CDP-glycerol glycerophosphotransferase family protein [Streptococcus suis]